MSANTAKPRRQEESPLQMLYCSQHVSILVNAADASILRNSCKVALETVARSGLGTEEQTHFLVVL